MRAAENLRRFNYDPAGRLTTVTDITGNPTGADPVPCTLRSYSFDAGGNRTTQTSATADSCPTTGGTRRTRAYDVADRPTTGANGDGAYTYDPLGRQTTIPAADAPHPAGGDLHLDYYDNDATATITQGETTIGYSLDAALRRKTQTTTDTAGVTTLVRHYTDSSDNPTWTTDVTNNVTTTTRYAELIAGGLGLTVSTTQGVTTAALAVSNPQGDIVSEVVLPESDGLLEGLASWSDFDEYGRSLSSQTVSGEAPGVKYGWLGSEHRATTSLGMVLLGARLFNPVSGLFSTIDPIYQGVETSYAYPLDPINTVDLDGLAKGGKQNLRQTGNGPRLPEEANSGRDGRRRYLRTTPKKNPVDVSKKKSEKFDGSANKQKRAGRGKSAKLGSSRGSKGVNTPKGGAAPRGGGIGTSGGGGGTRGLSGGFRSGRGGSLGPKTW